MTAPTPVERLREIRAHAAEVEAAHGTMSGLQLDRRDLLAALDNVRDQLVEHDKNMSCRAGGITQILDYLDAACEAP